MATATERESEIIRRSALRHLWVHNRDWVEMAESGGPTVIVSGDGVRVTDADGASWIDVNGGYSCVNVGYGRTEIAQAAHEQMLLANFCPVGTTAEPVIRLAAKLAQMAPGELNRVFLVSGGSEANETAIRIARAFHRRRGDRGRYRVISRKGSYHGMTAGVLWAGDGPPAPKSDFGPAYPGMINVPQPNPYRCELGGASPSECAVLCAGAVEDAILHHGPDTVAAFIGEPVAIPQGAPVPGDEYWPLVREICDRYGVVLIADEVVCGFGRTGRMFGMEHFGVVPDIMTVAKGIVSAYMPLAAAIVSDSIADRFGGGDDVLRHVLTNSGHPVAAAAGLRNIQIIEEENLVENAERVGTYLRKQLEGLALDHPLVGDVRGIGLFVAVELVTDRGTKATFPHEANIGTRLTDRFRERGLILRARENLIHLGPPLCLTTNDADEIVHGIDLALWEIEGEMGIGRLT